MPTVRAGSAADLWFGQGFCHGQDRLWQVEIQRRICSGRVSEIAGRAGLPVDRLMRTLGLRRVALREEAELDGDLRSLLDAYCAGLNEAARTSAAPPPELQLLRLEFEPWRPADMLAGGKLLSFGLSTNWERELLRADLVRELGEERAAKIDPTYPKGNPVVLRPGSRLRRRRPRARRADRPCPRPDRPGRGRQRLQQLGREPEPLGDRRSPARRRSAPSQRHAGGLVRDRPGARRALVPRSLDSGSPRHLPRPEQRRRLRLHQRDGRRRGPLRRADRR